MPTFNDTEGGASIRAKINAAIDKIDGVEAGAEVNPTGSEIVASIQSESDANLLSDAQVASLSDIRTAEQLQDLVAAMLQGGTHTNLTVTYDDQSNTIDLAASAGGGGSLSQEEVEDFVAGVSTAGTGINVAYDDAANTLTISLSGESYTTAEKNKLAGVAPNATANTGSLADLDELPDGSLTLAKFADGEVLDAASLTAKATPHANDVIPILDSEDGGAYKGAPFSSFGGAGAGTVDTAGTPANGQFARFTGQATIKGLTVAATQSALDIRPAAVLAASGGAGQIGVDDSGAVTGTTAQAALEAAFSQISTLSAQYSALAANLVPEAFVLADWTIADATTGGDADVTINSLPNEKGGAITGIEYQVDGGAWQASGGTGSFTISDEFTDGVEADVVLRAVNQFGPGDASDTKSVTTTETDVTAPTISVTSPSDNATDVALGSNITITFDEAIAFGTGNITLRDNDGGWSDLEVFDVTSDTGGGAGTVSISGNTLTIEPTSDLVDGIEYAIRIDATAIDDASDNSFAGIADDTTLNFTTEAPGSALVDNGGDTYWTSGSIGDSQQLFFSITFAKQTDDVSQILYETQSRSKIELTGGNNIYVRLENDSGAVVYAETTTETITVADGLTELIVDIDTSVPSISVTINGVPATIGAISTTDTIEFSRPVNGWLADASGGNIADIHLEELLFSNDGGATYEIDIEAATGAATLNTGANDGDTSLTVNGTGFSDV